MPLQLILGNSGSGKSHFLYKKVIEESIAHPEQNYMVIVPEQFTMQTQKDLVDMHPAGGIMNVDVLSFPRMAHRIFEEVGEDSRRVLTETGKNLMLRRIAIRLGDRLTVLGSRMNRTGYVSEVKSIMSELMQYEVGDQDLETMIRYVEDRPLLKRKLQEIRLLYREYLQYQREKFVKPEELLDLFCEAASDSKLLKRSVLAFDGFTGFTPSQLKTLRELSGLVRQIYVTVTIDWRENFTGKIQEHELFAMSKKMIQSLLRTVHGRMEADTPVILGRDGLPRFQKGGELEFLESQLFRGKGAFFKAKGETEGEKREPEISLHESHSPAAEVAFAARKIRELVTEKGFRYREIAIIKGDLSAYGHYVKKIFPKYEIPAFLDETRHLLLNPCLEFIRGALEAARKNLTYEAMFRYIRTGMTGVSQDAADRMENYVLSRGIQGWKRWNASWEEASDPGGGKGRGSECVQEETAFCEACRQQVMERYRPFGERVRKGKGRVRDFAEALLTLVEDCGIQQKLKDLELSFREEGKLEEAREYSQVYPVLVELLDEMVELLGEEQVTLREFSEILDAGFEEARVGIIPPGIDQVQVGDIERSRLAHVKVLFFLGLNDGWVPARGNQGGLVSDMEREILEGSGVELAPGIRENSYIQRFYLYQNLTKPRQGLILSWCRGSSDGKAMRPSYLVQRIRRLFPELSISDETAREPLFLVTSRENGMDCLTGGFQEARMGREKSWWRELYRMYDSDEAYRQRVRKLAEAAFSLEEGGRLSYQTSKVLYGEVLKNSVTRLEQFAACAFAHFAAYGLRLRERELFEVRPVDLGIVFHRSMELFSRQLQAKGWDWGEISREAAEPIMEQCVEQVAEEYGSRLLHSSARAEYTICRIKRILCRSFWAMHEQIKAGRFRPKGFEISFEDAGDLDAVRMELKPQARMQLQGRIDRIDEVETEEEVYIKIVDYKSGHARFDPVSVYYGLQLQLLVYMNAALELERRQQKEKKVIPAGVFYYQMQDPILDRDGKAAVGKDDRERLLKELRPQGLVNKNPEILHALDADMGTDSKVIPVSLKKDGTPRAGSGVASTGEFEQLGRYVNRKLMEMGRGILEGEIAPNPMEDGKQSACDLCIYSSVCGFDRKLPEIFKTRKVSVTKEEAWEYMTGEEASEPEGNRRPAGVSGEEEPERTADKKTEETQTVEAADKKTEETQTVEAAAEGMRSGKKQERPLAYGKTETKEGGRTDGGEMDGGSAEGH